MVRGCGRLLWCGIVTVLRCGFVGSGVVGMVFWKVVLLGIVGIQKVWVLDVRCGVRQCFFIKMVDQVKVLCLLRL